MPDIEFTCEHCDQSLEAPEDMAGEIIECPSCGQSINIPMPEGEMPEEDSAASCPSCGAALENDSVLCVECGYHLKLGKRIQTSLG